MKLPNVYILAVLLTVMAAGCDKDPGTEPQTTDKSKVLVNNPWRLTSVTDASGKAIPQNQLNLETQAIYLFDIQFFSNNVTKALDRTSKQVVNGGTWYLIENNEVLDIEVSQFKGKFPIKELSRSKMTLGNMVPVNGVNQEARLVFEPVVQ